jgi:hypothetical protein
MCWARFWAIFPRTHLVTLIRTFVFEKLNMEGPRVCVFLRFKRFERDLEGLQLHAKLIFPPTLIPTHRFRLGAKCVCRWRRQSFGSQFHEKLPVGNYQQLNRAHRRNRSRATFFSARSHDKKMNQDARDPCVEVFFLIYKKNIFLNDTQ